MALVFLESGQLGSITDSGRWNDADGGGFTYSTDTPRTGTKCIASALGDERFLQKTGLADQDTYIVGFAYRPSGLSTTAFNPILFRYNGTNQIVVEQQATTGIFRVKNGDGTVLATASSAPSAGMYQYLEFKATIHETTGSFELKLDGTSIASDTNVDTQNAGSALINQVLLSYHGDGSSYTYRFDDLYICDDTGSNNNDFIGDSEVECLAPDADGTTTQLTAQGGGDNYVEVDETGDSDDDTTYVESSTVDEKDTYSFGNLATTDGTVQGAIANVWARKDVAATRSVVLVARSVATETDSAASAVDITYGYHSGVFETDPNGGGAWSIASLNAAEFGVKIA